MTRKKTVLILVDRNPSRNQTDDESSGVWPDVLEVVCTATRMLVHFVRVCGSVPTLWVRNDALV